MRVTHTFIHRWNENAHHICLYSAASHHFGRYSFSIPHGVGGWVGLSGLSRSETMCTHENGHHRSTNRTRCWVTSLIRSTASLLPVVLAIVHFLMFRPLEKCIWWWWWWWYYRHCHIGIESVPQIIINDTVNFFLTAISICVISNHNSFRVLFDKIASVYFIWKNTSIF